MHPAFRLTECGFREIVCLCGSEDLSISCFEGVGELVIFRSSLATLHRFLWIRSVRSRESMILSKCWWMAFAAASIPAFGYCSWTTSFSYANIS